MAKSYFLPPSESGKRAWLNNFAGKISKYAALVGVTPAEVTQLAADALFFNFVCDAHNQHTKTTRDWTSYKQQAAHGNALGDVPVTPDLGTPPPTVPPDIFGRATRMAVRIKKHPACTASMAQDLGIVGAEQVIDPNSQKPVLTLSLWAGHPHISCPKAGVDSLEVLVDRGDGKGLLQLCIITIFEFTDNTPLPAPGASAAWKYKAIYRVNDAQVGEWSDVATIGVMG